MKGPDPVIWDEPEIHRALAHRDITAVYRLLQARGWPQRVISEMTGQSQSEISEIIKGRQVLAYRVLEKIAAGLRIPRGHLGLAYADADGNIDTYPEDEFASAQEDDDMRRRRFLGAASLALLGDAVLGERGGLQLLSGSPGHLDRTDIDWLRAAVEKFRSLDHEHGGTAVHAAARGMTEQVTGALRTSPPIRDLQLAVAELHRIAGWTAYDAGYGRMFWSHIATALDLARDADHPATVAVIVDDAARAEQLNGQHEQAAKLFELVTVQREPSAVDWGMLARSYAFLSPDATRHALSRAVESAGADGDGALGAMGGAWLSLGDHERAVAAFSRSLPLRPKGRAALTDAACLATGHLRAGETAEGLRYSEQALQLSKDVHSTVAADVMHGLAATLSEQHDSTAQDLARQMSPQQA